MPIYRYQCGGCGETNDYLVRRMGDDPGQCDCGSRDLNRVFDGAGPAVHTDSRTESRRQEKGVLGAIISIFITDEGRD
jgi:putative FmdB family regulatory protein